MVTEDCGNRPLRLLLTMEEGGRKNGGSAGDSLSR